MIWTSCYGHWRWFPEGCIRAAVSLQVPKESSFDIHIKPFAPTWELVQLGKSKEDRPRWTREYLALLDSRESAFVAAQKLKKMSFRNFKSYSNILTEISFEDTSSLNLIVGENGTGKTSIAECATYLLYGKLEKGQL